MRISDWSSDVCSSDLHARHRAIARHVDQRGGGCGTERHDLVIADHPVVDALRGERIDIGHAGQTDRFGARLRALLKREAEPDRGLARCARDQNLTRAIIALILRSEEHTSEPQSLIRISY